VNTQQLALGAVWYLAFLFSTTCHEAAHALIAKWGGDMTAAEGGQVTLNPIPHIRRSPFGMVVMPIVSFALGGWMIGWASAPFDPTWERAHPRRAARMALGGPVANFTIMLLAAAAIRIGVAQGYFTVPLSISSYSSLVLPASGGGDPSFVSSLVSILFVLNLLLGTFNLLPVPPLDGHSVVMLLMPERTAVRYLDIVRNGSYALLGLILAWYAYGYIFNFVFGAALRALFAGSRVA
jgi:Zn-dependent protease